MTSPREYDLFLQAVELEPPERERLLERECASDPALAARIRELLEIDQGLESEPPPLEKRPQIEGFEVDGELGRGATGVVYRARRLADGGRVAIKVLHGEGLPDDSHLRFSREIGILRLLDHPRIAHVESVETAADGRRCLVMEFVDGLPITERCDRNRSSIRERLTLFGQLCEAVTYAHRKTIVHRDLKPNNVLIAGKGDESTVKVIDFGISKILDGELSLAQTLTGAQGWLGTPAYMSPEQVSDAEGVDTRSDVYSLGALLYELICGTAPFESEQSTVTLRLVRKLMEDRPEPPSRALRSNERAGEVAAERGETLQGLDRELRDDLDWVALRALERDPQRRYASAEELYDDVRRYLDGGVVQARPPSLAYRARRYVARRPRTVGLVAALVVAVLFGTFQLGRASRAENRADREIAARDASGQVLAELLRIAAVSHERGETLEPRAINAALTTLSDVDLDETRRAIFASIVADPSTPAIGSMDHLGHWVAATTTLDKFGEGDRAFIDRLHQMAQVQAFAIDVEPASKNAERVLRLRRSHDPDPERLVASMRLVASLRSEAGSVESSSRLLDEALRLSTGTFGAADPRTLGVRLSIAVNDLHRDEQRRAEQVLRELHPQFVAQLGPTSHSALHAAYLLGSAAARRGDKPTALRYLREALEGGFLMIEKDDAGYLFHGSLAITVDPAWQGLLDDPDFIEVLEIEGSLSMNRAWYLVDIGRPQEALPHIRRALEKGFREPLAGDPYLQPLWGDPEFEALVALQERLSGAGETAAAARR